MSENISESPLLTRQKSLTTHPSIGKDTIIDYTPAYTLQKNNNRLQKAHRSRTKEIIDILSKFINDIEQWNDRWLNYSANNQSKINECGKLWDLFRISGCSIHDFIHKIHHIIDNLKTVRESIPKIEKQQTLEYKITSARANIDKLNEKLKQLNNQKKDLDRKIQQFSETSSTNVFACIKPQKDQENMFQRQTSLDVSIVTKNNSLGKEKEIFCTKQVKLYREWKKEELKRCRLLEKQSKEFLQSFDINSNEFDQLSREFHPEYDLNQCEEKIHQINTNQTGKSASKERQILIEDD